MPPGRRPFCNICRNGGQISILNATLATLGGIRVTCFDAQAAGRLQMLTLDQCADAQALAVGTCGCTGEVVPTTAPVVIESGMPTPAPTPATTPSPVTQPFCNVCGPFGRATKNSVIGSSQCFDVERMGMNGELDDLECIIAQIQVTSSENPCRCTGFPASIPSNSPTLFPTPRPTQSPTFSPTPRPSSSPTPAPTPSPVNSIPTDSPSLGKLSPTEISSSSFVHLIWDWHRPALRFHIPTMLIITLN